MKLASMDLTAEDVIDRGGINAAARGPESASEADLPGNLGRELAEATAWWKPSAPLHPPIDVQPGMSAGAQHNLSRRPGVLHRVVMLEGDAEVARYGC